MRQILTLLVLAPFACGVAADQRCATLKTDEIAALFDGWNLALASLQPDQVVARYWPDAGVFTEDSQTETTPKLLRDRLQDFLARRPRARIETRQVHAGCDMAVDAGAYTLSFLDAHGKSIESAGRYTFVYAFREGQWKILHHHSSVVPYKPASSTNEASAQAISPARPPTASSRGGTRPFLNMDASPSVASFYPPDASERGERGAVAIEVCAGPNGELQRDPQVLQSSGSERLDAAARAWAYAARWIPALRDNKPADGCTKVSVVFEGRA